VAYYATLWFIPIFPIYFGINYAGLDGLELLLVSGGQGADRVRLPRRWRWPRRRPPAAAAAVAAAATGAAAGAAAAAAAAAAADATAGAAAGAAAAASSTAASAALPPPSRALTVLPPSARPRLRSTSKM
jgi:hypothetical protein